MEKFAPADDPVRFLRGLFDQAVAAADPASWLVHRLPQRPSGRVHVIGAGKASARMAQVVERAWQPQGGRVITRYGHGCPTKVVKVMEAGHPTPDSAGIAATKQILRELRDFDRDDFVLALLSGGASSLLIAPAPGIDLPEKSAITAQLLASGAPISEINCVRKHLSAVKGGQLAAAVYPARLLSLVMSDVPGDDLATIGSGPTVGDRTRPEEAREILLQHNVGISPDVEAVLCGPSRVIAPNCHLLSRSRAEICFGPSDAFNAVMEPLTSVDVRFLGDAVEGEARVVGRGHARLALDMQSQRAGSERATLVLSGGEVTVTRRGEGVGGPNAEYCLALALALQGAPGIYALAGDTDGIDGGAEIAGAWITPDTLARARLKNVDAEEALRANDAHAFFGRLGNQFRTGATRTNVNDFRAILIVPEH